jgi:hypothetical protein
VDPKVAALMEREERRLRRTPGYRSSKRTLEKLADGYILFEGPASRKGAWDNFRVRNLGLAVERARAAGTLGTDSSSGLASVLSLVPDLARWTPGEKTAAARILRAKESGSEARYLRLMQRHPRLRTAFLALGSR